MLDAMIFGNPSGISSNQSEQYNDSNAIVGVSRNNIGLRIIDPRNSASIGADLQGRISVGMIAIVLAALAGFYVWTHNVQGGG